MQFAFALQTSPSLLSRVNDRQIAPRFVDASSYLHCIRAKIGADAVLMKAGKATHSVLDIGEDAMREACDWWGAVKH